MSAAARPPAVARLSGDRAEPRRKALGRCSHRAGDACDVLGGAGNGSSCAGPRVSGGPPAHAQGANPQDGAAFLAGKYPAVATTPAPAAPPTGRSSASEAVFFGRAGAVPPPPATPAPQVALGSLHYLCHAPPLQGRRRYTCSGSSLTCLRGFVAGVGHV